MVSGEGMPAWGTCVGVWGEFEARAVYPNPPSLQGTAERPQAAQGLTFPSTDPPKLINLSVPAQQSINRDSFSSCISPAASTRFSTRRNSQRNNPRRQPTHIPLTPLLQPRGDKTPAEVLVQNRNLPVFKAEPCGAAGSPTAMPPQSHHASRGHRAIRRPAPGSGVHAPSAAFPSTQIC